MAARLLLGLLLALPAAAAAQWWTEPPPLQIRLWTDKPAYRVGDTIRFGLAVNRDAYVALLNVGTSGGTTVIFPNRFHPSPRVEAGLSAGGGQKRRQERQKAATAAPYGPECERHEKNPSKATCRLHRRAGAERARYKVLTRDGRRTRNDSTGSEIRSLQEGCAIGCPRYPQPP